EFGATTGRPRRCGWIDLVALKYTCMINGITKVIMTKADVLDSFETLKVCTSYSIDGKETTEVPYGISKLKIDPTYKPFKGWHCDSTQIKIAANVPADMSAYIAFINAYIGAPIKFVSNGPERDQIITL
ncbi:MAG: adenylosuccinate synthetase, partial [Chitinophagaceae bacterium]|nr:adenylosuccinate synthetase [Chitinophagaceae bacterium]